MSEMRLIDRSQVKGESVDRSHVRLSEEESREINEQEDEGESAFDWKIDLRSQNVGIGW